MGVWTGISESTNSVAQSPSTRASWDREPIVMRTLRAAGAKGGAEKRQVVHDQNFAKPAFCLTQGKKVFSFYSLHHINPHSLHLG